MHNTDGLLVCKQILKSLQLFCACMYMCTVGDAGPPGNNGSQGPPGMKGDPGEDG